MTLTYYCPDCWAVIPEGSEHCPFCGYEIQQYHEADYEDKLLAALRHPVQDNRILAIQILGDLGSQRALDEFERILVGENADYYVLQAMLNAAHQIGGDQATALLSQATQHPSPPVQRLAERLLTSY